MLNTLIIVATVLMGAILLYPKVANSQLWRAAITSLASIIGSGFLILGPILDVSFGQFAPVIMALLCLWAYLFGAAIRFNIARLARRSDTRSKTEELLETSASRTLAFAYIISVAYYLNLPGAFAISPTEMDDAFHAKLVTSGVFAIILIVGWTQGFSALERMEQISVGLNFRSSRGYCSGLAGISLQRLTLEIFCPTRQPSLDGKHLR